MAEITLAASSGRVTGSRSSNRLRNEGKVPATVYGLGHDPVSVTIEWRELRKVLTTDAGLNALIDLSVDGGPTELTMVKDLQRHPVKRRVDHVDLLRVSRDQEITVDVPVVLVGEATKVLENDGGVDHVMFHLTITAKPAAIPNELTVDVSAMNIGDTIRVSDIDLPAGVVVAADPDDPVVSAHGLAAPSEEEEGEEAAEGEEAGEGEGDGGEEE